MRVKVCGITTEEDAEAALAAGADAIGMVFHPASPRRVDAKAAQRISARVQGRADCVAVLVDATLPMLRELVERFPVTAVQLHLRSCPLDLVTRLDVPVWPYVGIGPGDSMGTLPWWPDLPLMLDSLTPAGEGGTGQILDLASARAISAHRAIWLSGGLAADNVGAAVAMVRPFGVDASSRLESSPGVKDHVLVQRFVRAARQAAAALPSDNGG